MHVSRRGSEMARRLGRRKEPEKDKMLIKGSEKVEGGLSTRAAVLLSKFYNKGIIGSIGPVMATGKESDVYVASPGGSGLVEGEQYVILKLFRIENSSFFAMGDYIVGDPRFKRIGRTKQEIASIWCRKEFGNLEIAQKAGIAAPKPYMFNGNILAMQYIHDGDKAAPQLRNVELDRPELVLDVIIDNVRKLHAARLVHADLSEYNILMSCGMPYFIDFGQAVVTRHPNAGAFLRRDIWNILNYFKKTYGIGKDPGAAYKWITGRVVLLP